MFNSVSLKTPLLEDLYIELGGDTDIELLEESDGDESRLIEVFGHLPLLQKFQGNNFICQFWAIGGVPDELPSKLYSLTHLKLDDIDFGVFDNVAFILCLIRSTPCLESLDLSFKTWNMDIEQREHEQEKILKFLMDIKKNGIILDRLSTVKISGCSVCETEKEFVKLLLLAVAGNAVQWFKVEFHTIDRDSSKAIMKELEMFHQSFSERVPMEIS